jgi:predicted TIM-barrel fold metal-dependent hydrolase
MMPDKKTSHRRGHERRAPMKIVDAQVHLWLTGTPSGHHRQVSSYTAEELLAEMDEAGVDAALLHPPHSWDPNSNAQAIAAVEKYPDRFAILGQVPITEPETSRAKLQTWKQLPGMLGLRYPLINATQQAWVTDGTLDWLWAEAETLGLPVATMAGRFLPAFAKVAERHPNLKLIIDHCGLVRDGRDEAAFANLQQLLPLANHPNVALKATGAPGYSTAPYPFRNLHDGLHRIFDAFGPHRFFWGTDLTRMPCSYRQCVTMFTEELPWLKGTDLELVMGRGLCEWIGWKLPGL